jgi:hypothetical protein
VTGRDGTQAGRLKEIGRLLVAALAGWAALAASELVLLFGVLRVFALVLGPELLPSLKVVLDMGALAACGWVAGRVGRPRVAAAAVLAAAGLACFDLTPYLLLNVPWLLRLTLNAVRDSRYLSSLLTTLMMHALMFGSLVAGAYLSRPREAPIGLGVGG